MDLQSEAQALSHSPALKPTLLAPNPELTQRLSNSPGPDAHKCGDESLQSAGGVGPIGAEGPGMTPG